MSRRLCRHSMHQIEGQQSTNFYVKNYCRVCSEFFCCKVCRLDHEENNHGIYPECNICIYGRTFLGKPSTSLLQHFKAAHWPLHCVFCKTLFTSVEHLTTHNICTMSRKISDQENSNVSTIPANITEENYDSPPITATMHKSILTSSDKYFSDNNARGWLTTSTPMQNSDERELLQHIPEVITPVDYSEKTNTSDKPSSINASGINSAASERSKDGEPPLKRRVTFSEIEIITTETPYHHKKTKRIPSYEINSEIHEPLLQTPGFGSIYKNVGITAKNENKFQTINDDRSKSDMYVTAYNEELGDTPKMFLQEHKNNYNHYMDLTQSTGAANDDTAWESALMDANSSISEVPSTPLNSADLTDSFVNSTKSEILSPILHPNLTDANDLYPVTDSNLPQSDVFPSAVNENLTKQKSQSSEIHADIKSTSQSPTVNHNLMEPGNVQSHIIIMDGNLANSEIYSVVVQKNLTEVDASSTVDPNFKKSEDLYPILSQSPQGYGFVCSPVDPNLSKKGTSFEILTPIVNQNSTSETNLDFGGNSHEIDYDGIESCTTFGESTNTSQKSGIWSSMANIFKNMVQGLSNSAHGNNATSSLRISFDSVNSTALNDCIKKTDSQNNSNKRSQPESDASNSESPLRKKIKLTHIQCRRTIRTLRPFLELKYGRRDVQTTDKWTQTD